jgi:hypothetical protein
MLLRPLEDEMTESPALPFVGRVGSNLPAAGSARVRRSRGLGFDGVEAVEIVVPDFHSAALLVGYAAPSFWSEIVPGSAWTVRFQPWTPGRDWVVELLSLVERRLKSVPRPSAEAHDARRDQIPRIDLRRLLVSTPVRLTSGFVQGR